MNYYYILLGTIIGVDKYRFGKDYVIRKVREEFKAFTPPVLGDLYE